MKHDEYHRQFAEAIIEQIRQGTAPWQKPWGPGERVLPANVDTGRSYAGGNSLHLAAVAQARGYADVRWGTYRQIQARDGQVRKGEQGTRILSFQDHRKIAVTDERGRPVKDNEGKRVYRYERLPTPVVRQYNVFNAEQADGLPDRPIPTTEPLWKVHQHAERVLEDSGVPVRHMAGELIQQSCLKHGVQPQVLTLHSDRGAPMTSQCTAQLLADLGVTRSLSRPQVSDDNPFSEAQFKTLKYHPSFPGRFGGSEPSQDILSLVLPLVQRRAPPWRHLYADPRTGPLRSRRSGHRPQEGRAPRGLGRSSRPLRLRSTEASTTPGGRLDQSSKPHPHYTGDCSLIDFQECLTGVDRFRTACSSCASRIGRPEESSIVGRTNRGAYSGMSVTRT